MKFDIQSTAPPNNKGAELSVIGAILQDKRALVEAVGELSPDDFYAPEHKEIFDAAIELHGKKSNVDIVTVSDLLKKRGMLEGVGGTSYLLEAYRYVPTTVNVKSYIAIVKEQSKLRKIIAQCRQTEQACYTQMQDTDAIVEDLRSSLRRLDKDEGGLLTMADVLSSTLDYFEKREKGEVRRIMTGIAPFDHFMGGLRGGEITVVGARPSVGKSAVAQIAAINAAKDYYTYFVSLEMSAEQLGTRAYANDSGICISNLNDAIGDEQWVLLGDSANRLSSRKVVFDTTFPTVEKIEAKCYRMADQKKLDLVVIDYLQLLKSVRKMDSRNLELGEISRTLKKVALTLDIHIILLSQLNRDNVRARRAPNIADLRDSGCIEQDADNILLLHEPEEGSGDIPEEDRELAKILLDNGNRYLLGLFEKQRNGPRGKIGMAFYPENMRITGIERS